MVRNSDDKIPLTQSPSITQETKVRFNQLLNAALSNETLSASQEFKQSRGSIPNRQSEGVPTIIPRQKLPVKSSDAEKHGNISSICSSEESSGSRKFQRQVIAEVHSSQTHLLPSSSDDDILSEKKEKRKRKKSRWKQANDSAQLIMEEGQENSSFHVNEEVMERSSSRLSSRSYTVDKPTFPVENIKLLTGKVQIQESPSLIQEHTTKDSPSRISSRSYIIETPTFPFDSFVKDESILPKIKTPVPLPRRKSLKSLPDTGELDPGRSSKKGFVDNVEIINESGATVINIHNLTPQQTEDDTEILRSGARIKLQEPASQGTEEDGDMPLSVRKQKRKKRRRKSSKSRERMELQELSLKGDVKIKSNLEEKVMHSTIKSDVKNSSLKEKPIHSSGEQIVGMTIHAVDCPIVDPLVRHPVVRLYTIDTSTGEYYKKSDPDRSVCYYGENTSYVQPIMTHPFDFKQHRSVTPAWEECLLLNESASHLLTASTLLLFELCDFLTTTVASDRHSGWHIVAWAFLRPGPRNLATRLRLQLYKPGRRPKTFRPLTPDVYEWWGTADRHKYPGCLYVTVMAVNPPSTPFSPRLRSRLAMQAEEGSIASVRSASAAGSNLNSDDNIEQQEERKAESVVWSRLAVQSCKLPNTRLCSLPVDGSMCLQFSGNGLWLACARQDIHLYSVPQFQHTTTLSGHQALVYSLRWNTDSKVLLSASADCTVCVWKPNHRKAPLLQMLAHPSFVYCAQFVLTPGYCTVVTGCYDTIVRLWQGETHSSYQLAQEFSGHGGFVTCVCVTVDGAKVISADSLGSLRIYDVEDGSSLSNGRELRVREVRGTAINNVVPHPGGHRLLVHSRDSTVRSVDIATGAVLQTFKDCTNEKLQTGMCVSACGGLVFACGEDGSLTTWDGHTGALRAVYCRLLPPGSAAVHYHPHEHMLALASLSQPPVYILTFDRNASGEDIGLNTVKNEVTAADVIEKMKLIQNANKWQKAASKVTSTVVQDRAVLKKNKKKKESERPEGRSEKEAQSKKWPSLPKLECYVEKSSGDKDLRLLEIIRKMDSMILAAKQSSQSQ